MSPATDNFIHSLVEMSKAFETLPTVQQELDKTKAELDAAYRIVSDREESILKLKSEIETLNEKVRQSEVARDTAETMFLETDDKLAAFRRLVEAFGKDTQSLIAAQEPPKPEPQPEAKPVPQAYEQGMVWDSELGWVQPKPIDNPFYSDPQRPEPVYGSEGWGHSASPNGLVVNAPTSPTLTTVPSDHASPQDAGSTSGDGAGGEQGQSVSDPTPVANTASAPTGDVTSTSGAAAHSDHPADVRHDYDPKPEPVRLQPYAGKRYVDHPTYVNFHDWIDGGGTEADYYAR